MTQDRTENSRAPPMRHHGFKRARRVSDTYKMCDCFILSCSKNVLIYRNIHFSKIYPRIVNTVYIRAYAEQTVTERTDVYRSTRFFAPKCFSVLLK